MTALDQTPALPGPIDEIAAEAARQRAKHTIDFERLQQATMVELVRSAVERVRTGDLALRSMLVYVAALCHNALAAIDRRGGTRATASAAGEAASADAPDRLVERARVEMAPPGSTPSPGDGSAGYTRRPPPEHVRKPFRDDE